MKRLLMIFVIAVGWSVITYGQSWPKKGTQWIYKLVTISDYKYLSIKIDRDTIIDNDTCMVLKSNILYYFGLDTMIYSGKIPVANDLIIKYKNDYLYYLYRDEWESLYSFNLNIGDEIMITGQDTFQCHDVVSDTFYSISNENIIKVKDIKSVDYAGIELSEIEFSDGEYWNIGSIFKGIGPRTTFLPYPQCPEDNGVQDFQSNRSIFSLGEGLVCFEDGNNMHISQNEILCQDMFRLTDTKDISDGHYNTIIAYPNPANDYLYIPDDFRFSSIDVINSDGLSVLKATNTGNKIDISSLKQGLYFGKIIIGDNFYLIKFLKL
ncbi:MAG: T9SS type A sorting domain-containing protein [Saprospiraceae bacterium]